MKKGDKTVSFNSWLEEVTKLTREATGIKTGNCNYHYAKRDYNQGRTAEQSARLFARAWNKLIPRK